MGDFFEPDITQAPGVSPAQQQIQALIAQQLPGLFGGGVIQGRQTALADLLAGTPTDSTAISNALLRQFDQDIVPRINTGFAGIGGSLSSRRGVETSRALGDVQSQIGAIQAGLTESARQRQLGAIQQVLAPFGVASSFSTSNTLENIAQASPFAQVLGLGGTLGSAALLGDK